MKRKLIRLKDTMNPQAFTDRVLFLLAEAQSRKIFHADLADYAALFIL